GAEVDFEYLVRLLVPQPMDPRVGTRDLDVQKPALNLAAIPGPDADGVLRLGGALKIPRSSLDDAQRADADRFEHWDQPRPHPFQRDLAAFINLADDYRGRPDPDPLVTPPLYGRWHSLTPRLVPEQDNWVHGINLDPRHRTAAGLGTQV